MKNKKWLFILILLLFQHTFSTNHTVKGQNVPNPSEFFFEIPLQPSNLDPSTNYEIIGSGINELMLETLVDYQGGSTSSLKGVLAEFWTISSDGLKYTFKLREGVKYHDGVDFNAYTMKYSLDRAIIMNDHFGPAWMLQQVIKGGPMIRSLDDANINDALNYLSEGGVTVIDDFTLEINLEQVYTPFIKILAYRVGAAISPKAVIENAPFDYTLDSDDTYGQVPLNEWFPDIDFSKLGLSPDHNPLISGVVPSSPSEAENAHDWMNEHSVGTGPYKFVELDPGIQISLEKNENWWLAGFAYGAPEMIYINIVPDDITRISNLKEGLADQIMISSTFIDEITDGYSRFDSLGTPKDGLQVFSSPSPQNYLLGFNLNDSISSEYVLEDFNSTYDPIGANLRKYGFNNPDSSLASPSNPFSAVKFREALANSFDYETYLEQATNNFAQRSEGLIPNGMFGHVDTLIEEEFIPRYNPDLAKSLFMEVGWRGVMTLPYNSNNLARQSAMSLLKNNIEDLDVGINVNIEELPWVDYLESLRAGSLPISQIGWFADYDDPDNFVTSFAHSQKGFYSSRTYYQNLDVDKLIELAASEMDINERESIYRDIEESVALDYVFMYSYQNYRLDVMRDWVKGFEESGSLNPMSSMPNFELMYKGNNSYPNTSSVLSETTTTTSEYFINIYSIFSDVLLLGIFVGSGSGLGFLVAIVLRRFNQ